ncbi:phosphoadenylyl-sulfate reductase [Actinomycetota bacterium]
MSAITDATGQMRPEAELHALVTEHWGRLEGASAHDVIVWAAATFGERWAVAASMQDGVLAHLAQEVAPGVRLVFLDTGYHFPETLATRDALAARPGHHVLTVTPGQTVAEQDATHGAALHDRDPDLCCALRKTHPLDEALDGLEAWATGLRRAQSAGRASTAVLGFDERRGLVKIAPLASWTDAQIADYVASNDVVRNPLLDQGYPSIGCAPCTRRAGADEDSRAGRWSGTGKTECGIHL